MPSRERRGTIVSMSQAECVRDFQSQAKALAGRAAERSGTTVRSLETLRELDDGSRLISQIWDDDDPKAPTSLLRALAHAGNFVAGAFHDDRLVGISFGFFGFEGSELLLHSHITGVDRAFQGRSVGFALKQYQRAWALEHGASTVVWTADPLVRGNAFFNLMKLGAAMVAYHENFYGTLEDGLNSGESDRAVLRWDLSSERAVRAGDGTLGEPDEPSGRVILQPDESGFPATAPAEGRSLRAWLPESIVRIRDEAPELAAAWRRAMRETVGRAIADGFRAEAISRDGWLLLRR
jgi:predicted GNAT superfamily acetyltransferase